MAAALRLLLRRRAEAPSLALLQPLFPRPYSKLSIPPVPSPSLLRCTSGKPSSPLRPISAISNIIGMQSMQIHPPPPQVASLIRHYSSKGCALLLPQQPIDHQTFQSLKQAQSLLRAVNSLPKHRALVLKGIKTCRKAFELLEAGVDDDKAYAMFEKGSDDALNALAVYEKDLDVLAKGLGSAKEMQLDIDPEPEQMMCKETKNSRESMRQGMKKLQRSRETQRTMEKIGKWLDFASVVLEAFVLLLHLLRFWGYI